MVMPGGGIGTEKKEVDSEDGSQSIKSEDQSRIRRTVRKVSRTGGTWATKYREGGIFDTNDIRHWDVAPNEDYFNELFRISEFQIIWGGNYFELPVSRNFIIWRKLTISENFSMAMAEYAWTNIPGNSKLFSYAPQDSSRFHPTQKPVALYKWLLKNYAKPGDKIFDSHMGSQSSRIACWDGGFDFWGCELDKDYFDSGCKRFENHIKQLKIF